MYTLLTRCLVLFALVTAFVAINTSITQAEDVSIDGWGTVVDPDGDCKISANEDVLTIKIPNTRHDLNKRNGSLNAPRVLQEVTGDFRIEVTVSGKFKPGPQSTAQKSTPFNGAGILLWHDERSHIRLERNTFGGGYCYPPLFELRHKGKYLGANSPVAPDTYFKGESTGFRLERRGKVIIAYIQNGTTEWALVKSRMVDLPDKLLVGVSAINTSSDPMTVQFKDFKLTKLE